MKAVRNEEKLFVPSLSMATTLVYLAEMYPQDWLIWCEEDLSSNLDSTNLEKVFHHHKIMASYGIADEHYIPAAIGYVEQSPFINVNKTVTYPTWLMSSTVGGIHSSVLLQIGTKIKQDANFDYFINSVAKVGMTEGLFCYSDPRLLINLSKKRIEKKVANSFTLFRFVKQHYKKRWLLLLLLNLLLFEGRLPFMAFCYALFFKNRKKLIFNLDTIEVQSTIGNFSKKTIDVIIPTIGRKQFLYDVLQDLAKQTHLPEKVIIVEQNPEPNSISELDYITNESWPFTIKPIFIHQSGACNARNLALAEVSSEWVFLNDDDNRFGEHLIGDVFAKVEQYGAEVITTPYLQVNEIQYYNSTHQSGIFGSGNSFVKSSCLENIRFDRALEFGYGEDTDFGLQLRNQGFDVIYFPDLKIIHLKAPIGGFRMPIKKEWEFDIIQPKPSPTIMYLKKKNNSKEQIKGYKLILFFKYYRLQNIKNPIQYYCNFKKQWKQSVFWANVLKNNQ